MFLFATKTFTIEQKGVELRMKKKLLTTLMVASLCASAVPAVAHAEGPAGGPVPPPPGAAANTPSLPSPVHIFFHPALDDPIATAGTTGNYGKHPAGEWVKRESLSEREKQLAQYQEATPEGYVFKEDHLESTKLNRAIRVALDTDKKNLADEALFDLFRKEEAAFWNKYGTTDELKLTFNQFFAASLFEGFLADGWTNPMFSERARALCGKTLTDVPAVTAQSRKEAYTAIKLPEYGVINNDPTLSPTERLNKAFITADNKLNVKNYLTYERNVRKALNVAEDPIFAKALKDNGITADTADTTTTGATTETPASGATTPGAGTATAPATGGADTPGAGDATVPATGGAETPGAGTATAPATGGATTPGAGDATAPATGGADTPGAGDATAPAAGGADTPGAGTATAPATGGATTPGAGDATAPATGGADTPGAGTATAPATGGATTPGAGTATAPAGGTTTPGAGTATAPATGGATTPAAGTATAPAAGDATTPAAGAEDATADANADTQTAAKQTQDKPGVVVKPVATQSKNALPKTADNNGIIAFGSLVASALAAVGLSLTKKKQSR